MSQESRLDARLRQHILDHTLGRLAATQATAVPFPHISVESFFPADVYEDLLDRLPPAEKYKASGYKTDFAEDGASNRARFRFSNEWFSRLPDGNQSFWYSVRGALGSDELKHAVYDALADGMAYRFGCDKQTVASLPGYARPELYRETRGYSIKPHPDTRKKVVTMQIALPRHSDQTNLGTQFYRRSFNPAHWSREPKGFETVCQAPFLPNSAYAFVVLNTLRIKSWHGRSALPENCGVRNTLLNIWYANVEDGNPDLIRENEQHQLQVAAA